MTGRTRSPCTNRPPAVETAVGVSQAQEDAGKDAEHWKSAELALPHMDLGSSCGNELASMATPEAVSTVSTILRNARSLMPT